MISWQISNAHSDSKAAMIKFSIDEASYSPGDVVVVLDDSDIRFHGIIGKIESGYAFAYDPKGSLLPGMIQ